MCGIAGLINLGNDPVEKIETRLKVMNHLIAHRGPDGQGIWTNDQTSVGLAHRRLAIIDLTEDGAQPMHGQNATSIVFNGEIYNYPELKAELASNWRFSSSSDTETILAGYDKWGEDVLTHLRGMFSFALWDEKKQSLFCARDRFGIKPYYYTVVDGVFYFASEAKALLPFLKDVDTDSEAMSEYITFQYTIGEKTLFKGIYQLLPGHALRVSNGDIKVWRYWDVNYEIDYDHSQSYFENRLKDLVNDSVKVHLRSDVPVGAYVSGGIDSSLMGLLAARHDSANRKAFNGRFTQFDGYDESGYAQIVADEMGGELHISDMTHEDFRDNIGNVIYHLDFPVAGPGSFPQYMVSKLASEHVKVVLGGQGGDEIFGGYARYLLAYFEQCINAAMEGTYKNGNYVVTIESIIPNLGLLREYKPLMREFWREGLFGPLDERYFRLVNRSNDMKGEIDFDQLNMESVLHNYKNIFNNKANVRKEAYLDSMTHFDFKCLLPALLQVEDRMSMAHGLESRVPLLDHSIVEFAASVPADIKFNGGKMKHLIKAAFGDVIPEPVLNRRDKMGFPVPLKQWLDNELRDMVLDIFKNLHDKHRPYINTAAVLENFDKTGRFSRKVWGLLSLEIWHQTFHDKGATYRALLDDPRFN